MKQVNVLRKKDLFQIEIRCHKTQILSQREADIVLQNTTGNFLPFTPEQDRRGLLLKYTADGLLSLPEFLQTAVLSKRLFLYIVRQYIHLDKQLEENHFKRSSVLFRPHYVLINPTSWHLYFVYVPVQPFEAEGTLRESLQDLIQYAAFDPNEDPEYVREFIRLVGSEVSFSVFLLEAYLKKYDWKEKPKAADNRCAGCGYALQSGDAVCPMCGKAVGAVKGKAADECFYTDVSAGGEPVAGRKNAESAPRKSQNSFSVYEDDTGLVTVFRAPKSSGKQSVYLTGSRAVIPINKFPFRIGKQEDIVDWRIQNSAVSRKHADIMKEQGRYYLVDLGSTNGTYINGRRVQCGVKEELTSGASVTFANENYIFSVTEE